MQRLSARGHKTSFVGTAGEAIQLMHRLGVDLVVLAPPLPDGSPSDTLSRMRSADATLPVVVAGSADFVRPEQLMFEGAFECVLEPLVNADRLLSAVGYALGAREEDRELRYLRSREVGGFDLGSLIGQHESMARVFQFVRRICERTAQGPPPPILILGETGTGKGALARAIHHHSVRRNRPFVQVNCAAIPAHLVESELFGHERGAFTDAQRARPGLIETAHRGALFLDELPSLTLDVQAKLLTAIEEQSVRRVGGNESLPVDVQVIAAAQPNLKSLLRSGRFREDLYHRLNVLTVSLPPLRERGEDRVRLAEHFAAELCRKYQVSPLHLTDGAKAFIQRYHWPGNVRELRNQIERIVLLGEADRIEAFHFERASGELLRVDPSEEAGEAGAGFRLTLPPKGIALEELEREVIRAALQKHGGNVSQTARYLSVTRQTLIYRIKKHGLEG
ncbi:MAG: sigma-54 dependent transcriptional regulator [Sandaracinaceae bacterium]|nr:sigma-54 dependent transcriptional regulator [Sandaracinaceae bacterium]